MRFSKVWLAGIVAAAIIVPLAASALTPEVQAQIAILLQRVQQLQALIDQLRAQQDNTTTTTSCVDLTHNMGPDDTDSNSGGDVTRLQRFLAGQPGIYPEGLITGYYGPATTRAVQRWQAEHGIASSGTPETTGYGYVGPRTREEMGCGNTGAALPNLTLTVDGQQSVTLAVGQTFTIGWSISNAASCSGSSTVGTSSPTTWNLNANSTGSATSTLQTNASILYTQTCTNERGSTTKTASVNPTGTISSCTQSGVTVANGASRTFYSTQNSTSCLGIGEVRTCTNGVLSGATSSQYAFCSPPAVTGQLTPMKCVSHNYCSNGNLYYQNDANCAETLHQASALQCTEGSIKGMRCVSHYYCSAGNLYYQNDADCAVTLNQANSAQCGGTGEAGGAVATNFTATPPGGAAPLSVTFNATLPAAQSVSEYSVDFGDGSNGSMARKMEVGSCSSGTCATATDTIYVSHTYTSPNTYTAKLKKVSTQIATQTVSVTGGTSVSLCTLDGVTVVHGQSRTFYSTQNSTTCATNMNVRTCTNGTLSESSSYQYSTCSPPAVTGQVTPMKCVTHNYCSAGNLYYQNDANCAETLHQASALQCTEGSIKGMRCVSHFYCSGGSLFYQNDADCSVALNQANAPQCAGT